MFAAGCRELQAGSLRSPIRRLPEDAKIRMRETTNVWQDSRQIGGAHAEPGRERGGEFVHRSCRNPAALAGIVRAIHREGRERSEQSAALDGATEHKLVAPPPVIGARAIRWISAAKVRRGKSRDLLGDAELDRGGIEGVQGLAKLGEKISLACKL